LEAAGGGRVIIIRPGPVTTAPTTIGAPDPTSLFPHQLVTAMGEPPTGFAAGDGSVYLLGSESTNPVSGALFKVNATTGHVTATANLGGRGGVGLDTPLLVGSDVWVAVATTNAWNVLTLSAGDLRLVHRLVIPQAGTDFNRTWPQLAAAGGSVWAAGGPVLYRLSADDTVTGQYRLETTGGSSLAANIQGSALAVALANNVVEDLGPSTGVVLSRLPAGTDYPTMLEEIIGNRVWAAGRDRQGSFFANVDLSTGATHILVGAGYDTTLIPLGAHLLVADPDGGSNCFDPSNGAGVAEVPAKVNHAYQLTGAAQGWLYGWFQGLLERTPMNGC
jgi:hypothetical protein